jgi:hypothetical protein
MQMTNRQRVRSIIAACAMLPCLAYAQDDFERRAAEAALTERGFYESGGARDPAVAPAELPVIRPASHIEEADRKVAEKEAARRAAQQAAEESKAARLIDQLEVSRAQYRAILGELNRQRANYQAELDAAGKANSAERVRTLKGQVAAIEEAIAAKQNEVVRNETRMQTEIVKALSGPRAAEESRRVAEATGLASRLRTQEAQIETGSAVFEERLKTLDAAISQARANGLGEVAGQFERDRRKTAEAQQAYLASQEAARAAMRNDLHRAYATNRADGLGPTNSAALYSAIRRAAIASGRDPVAAVDLVDQGAVDNTAASAARIASGAPASSEHVSVFNEVNSDSLRDFALDYAAEARVTYGSWEGFKGRVLEGYVAGVGRGTLDAIKGLFDLVVGLGDLTGEALEDAVNRLTGSKIDVFGDEKMNAFRSMLESGSKLFGQDEQTSMEEARKLLATAEAIQTLMRRKAEQMAGSGEKGIRQAINIVGQAAPQVLGAEELAVRGAATAARAAGTAARVVTGTRKADAALDGARVAGAASDAGRGTDAARAGEAAGAGGMRPETAPDRAPATAATGAEGRPALTTTGPEAPAAKPAQPRPDAAPQVPPQQVLDDTPTDVAPGRPAGEARTATGQTPPARAPPGRKEAVFIRPDGSATLVTGDERQFPLGKELGRGSTTTVYDVPGREGIVVKVTTGGADALDDAGYKVIKNLDPNGEFIEVPTIHRRYEGAEIRTSGGDEAGVITVAEKAPSDFKHATDIKTPSGGMTPGQAAAYRRGLDKLNEQGFVWLDSKHDNFTFRKVSGPDGDEWRLVVLDPGGIVPMKGRDADAALALQRALDSPSEASRAAPDWEFERGPVSGRALHQMDLARRFDHLVDWEAIQRITGKPFSTLGKDASSGLARRLGEIFPFNPRNGLDYPQLSSTATLPTPTPPPAVTGPRTGVGSVDRAAPTVPDSDVTTTIPPPARTGTPTMITGPADDAPTQRLPSGAVDPARAPTVIVPARPGTPTVITQPGAAGTPTMITGPADNTPTQRLPSGATDATVAPGAVVELGADRIPTVRTHGSGLKPGDPAPISGGDGTRGGEGRGELLVGGGFAVQQIIKPIYFEFGGGRGPLPPIESFARLRLGGGTVQVQQVINISGNNPFDPLDPIGEGLDRRGSSSPPPAGGGLAFVTVPGAYVGTLGCGIGATTLSKTTGTVTLNPLGAAGSVTFNVLNNTTARSSGTNLFILGALGHTCELRNGLPAGFQLYCWRTATPAINCTENF